MRPDKTSYLECQRVKRGEKNQPKPAQENPSRSQIPRPGSVRAKQELRNRAEVEVHDAPLYRWNRNTKLKLNCGRGFTSAKVRRTPKFVHWTARLQRLPPEHRLPQDSHNPEISWDRKNEGGIFRNGRGGQEGKAKPRIQGYARAWCDAHACSRTGDRSFPGCKQKIRTHAALDIDDTA